MRDRRYGMVRTAAMQDRRYGIVRTAAMRDRRYGMVLFLPDTGEVWLTC